MVFNTTEVWVTKSILEFLHIPRLQPSQGLDSPYGRPFVPEFLVDMQPLKDNMHIYNFKKHKQNGGYLID